LNNYLSQLSSSSSPPLSGRVLQEIQSAWTAYFYKTLLAALPPSSQPESQTYEGAQAGFNEIEKLSRDDSTWVEKQKERDEKFTMYLTSIKTGYEGLKRAEEKEAKGETGLDEAKELVESNRDAVGLWLDKQVRADPLSTIPSFHPTRVEPKVV
jgi:cysteinyl-tRNA synthetase